MKKVKQQWGWVEKKRCLYLYRAFVVSSGIGFMSTNIGFAKPYPRIFGQAFIQGEKFFLEESGVIFR